MKAFHVLDNGIKNTSEEKCVMNFMAGNSLYNTGEYEGAITYYKEALWHMTINEYEAIYKLCIAKCYKKLGKYDEGLKWLDDAVSEVKKNEKMVEELKAQYFAD
ncbi:MAG: tetratricopeptide repeat protein [Synergistaceae bacterium]|nr:tetratricopeptide repeat protein [Synergistaceae bacterium]MBQ6114264.1 tetratricopeptide repeat protein [Synergistaceae bacterium]